MTDVNEHRKKRNKRITLILGATAFGMFFFGFALVPLYNVLCKAWGINGKTNRNSVSRSHYVDPSRTITVEFLANTNANLPWEFKPLTKKIDIHPGENVKVGFFTKNLSNHTMTIQAIPSVTPGLAAKYLKKTECFCFRQQTLQSHQAMNMPLIFHIDTELPYNIHTVTLSYTLFEAPKHKS